MRVGSNKRNAQTNAVPTTVGQSKESPNMRTPKTGSKIALSNEIRDFSYDQMPSPLKSGSSNLKSPQPKPTRNTTRATPQQHLLHTDQHIYEQIYNQKFNQFKSIFYQEFRESIDSKATFDHAKMIKTNIPLKSHRISTEYRQNLFKDVNQSPIKKELN